jgi:hypothetical protein
MNFLEEVYYCNDCYNEITPKVNAYSIRYYGLPLCMDHQKDHATEGEEILAEFFKEEGIKFERAAEKLKLKGDLKNYRIPDFYLPKFKLYVEFFGQWNIQEHRNRYVEKKRVYDDNRIPCIYIYPENLAMLKQIFYLRVERELKINGAKKELFSFNLFRIWQEVDYALGHLVISSILFFILYALDFSKMNLTSQFLGLGFLVLSFLYFSLAVVKLAITIPEDLIKRYWNSKKKPLKK